MFYVGIDQTCGLPFASQALLIAFLYPYCLSSHAHEIRALIKCGYSRQFSDKRYCASFSLQELASPEKRSYHAMLQGLMAEAPGVTNVVDACGVTAAKPPWKRTLAGVGAW